MDRRTSSMDKNEQSKLRRHGETSFQDIWIQMAHVVRKRIQESANRSLRRLKTEFEHFCFFLPTNCILRYYIWNHLAPTIGKKKKNRSTVDRNLFPELVKQRKYKRWMKTFIIPTNFILFIIYKLINIMSCKRWDVFTWINQSILIL